MAVDLALARKAKRTGLSGHELGKKLGVSHGEAITLADVGRKLARIDGHALKAPEILAMKLIAEITREGLRAGDPKTPQSSAVSQRAGRSSAWCASTVGKRLFVSRHNRITGQAERGLGFVELTGNGNVWLTPTGWALIHAMDAVR